VSAITGIGTPVLISTDFESDNCTDPVWSPDGKIIAFGVSNGSQSGIAIEDATGLGNGYLTTNAPSSSTDNYPCFSPDGLTLAFVRTTGSSGSIYTAPVAAGGNAVQAIGPASGGASPSYPAWSPFPSGRLFITSGGTVSTAGGFIWGQSGDAFASFTSVVATTPADCSIALEAKSQGPAPIYEVKADNITQLVYSNQYYGATTILNFSGVSQMLVAYGATSGQVDTVAPFDLNRTAGSPKPTFSNGRRVYTAKFTALYNNQGKNIAPNGASQIQFDSKTGHLVSWR